MHHRTVMGREQRAQTRAKIVEAATGVFARKGAYTPVINDFIQAAAIARGTFYYYFDSVEAVRAAAVDDIARIHVEEVQLHFKKPEMANPILRFSTAIRLYQRRAVVDPLFAGILTAANRVGTLMQERAIADLTLALRQGLIKFPSAEAAFAMTEALSLYAARYPEKSRPTYLRSSAVVRTILRAMRANEAMIEQALSIRLLPFKVR